MFYSNYKRSFASILITFVFTIGFTGQVDGNLSLISPFHFKSQHLEEKYFQKADRTWELEKKYEGLVKSRISDVMGQYKTGLKNVDNGRIPELIYTISQKYGYDPLFLTAVIITESSFNNWARSRVGALGLMQIRPQTGLQLASETNTHWKGKPTLFDPETNIALGAYYLNKLTLRFGDLSLALEAYNHGPSRIRKYLKRGYRPKTYSRKVYKNYKRIRQSI